MKTLDFNIKLLSYLDQINSNDLYKLKRYIHSDYFNTNQRLKTVFDELMEARIESGSFKNIDIAAFCEDQKKLLADYSLKDTFSDILKLVREFVAQEVYNQDKDQQTCYLLAGLEKIKAKDDFRLLANREARKYEKGGLKNRTESFTNYMYDFQISEKKFVHYSTYENRKKVTNNSLQELIYSLDRFYAMYKLTFMGVMIQRKILMSAEFDYGLNSDFEQFINKETISSFPMLQIRYYVYQLWSNNSTTTFEICKNQLFKSSDRLTKVMKRELFSTLLNFCSLRTVESNFDYWKQQYFELYQQFFELKLCFLEAKKRNIYYHHYQNYVRALIQLNKFELYTEVEAEYLPIVDFVNPPQRRFVSKFNTASYNHGLFLSYQSDNRDLGKDFSLQTCLKLIEEIDYELMTGKQAFPDAYNRILFDVLTLKVNYELPRGFKAHHKKFKKYLRSIKHISFNFLEPFLNFAYLSFKLHQFKQASKQIPAEDFSALRNDLEQMRTIERKWLETNVSVLGEAVN